MRKKIGPGRPPGRSQKSRDSELRILYAAADCIARNGIEGTTLRAIARQAKSSPGLVSHYFPRKSQIFERIIRQIMELAYQTIESPPAGTAGTDLVMYNVRANLAFFLKHASFYKCFILFFHLASFQPRMKALNGEATRRAIARLESLVDPRTARLVHGHLVAAILKFYITPQTDSPAAYSEKVLADIAVLLDLHS
jgi:AcrR family transcriptional regulator